MQLAAGRDADAARRVAGADRAGGGGAARGDRRASATRPSSLVQGERATLTFTGVPAESLRTWLGEARSARARPAARGADGQGGRRLQRLDHRQRRRARHDPAQAQPPALERRPSPAAAGANRRSPSRPGTSSAARAVRWAIAGALVGVARRPRPLRAGRLAGAARSRRRADQRLILADAAGHDLVGQRRPRPHRRRRQPRREHPARPARVDAVAAPRTALELAARQALLHQRHAADPDPARPRPRSGPRSLPPTAAAVGQWPSAWLERLGTPLEHAAARRHACAWSRRASRSSRSKAAGASTAGVDLELEGVSSRLTTLDTLGSYRVTLTRRRGRERRDPAFAVDAGRRAPAHRRRHLGAGRRASSAARRARRRPTRRRCRTCSTSSVDATARGRSFRSDDHDRHSRPSATARRVESRRRGRRRRRCCIASLPLPAARPQPPTPRFRGEPVTLNFVNADIEGVPGAMAAILRQQFVVDPRVKGKITLYSDEPLTPSEAYLNFLAALRGLGFTVVEVGGLFKVVPEADAKLQTGTRLGRRRRRGAATRCSRRSSSSTTRTPNNLVPVLRPLITPTTRSTRTPATTRWSSPTTPTTCSAWARSSPRSTCRPSGDVEVIPLQATRSPPTWCRWCSA